MGDSHVPHTSTRQHERDSMFSALPLIVLVCQIFSVVRVWTVPSDSFPLGAAGLRLPPKCAGFW